MKSLILSFFMSFFLLACSGGPSNFPQISTEDLAAQIESQSVKVFDANSKETFEKNHIPGAIYFDYKSGNVAELPQDKSQALVFYCANEKCMASHRAADIAAKNGYKNIKIYGAGIQGWMKAGQKVESFN